MLARELGFGGISRSPSCASLQVLAGRAAKLFDCSRHPVRAKCQPAASATNRSVVAALFHQIVLAITGELKWLLCSHCRNSAISASGFALPVRFQHGPA